VSHEEVRGLLSRYAAGTLDPEASEVVRSHLATGCGDCLGEMFRRPVGLARTPPPAPEPPVDAAPPRRRRGPLVAGLALVVILPVVAGWAVVARTQRVEAERRAEADRRVLETRVVEAEVKRAELAQRLTALEQDVGAAQSEASRQAEAVRTTAEESAQLRGDLEAARASIAALMRRDGEIERQIGGVPDRQTVETIVGTPGVQLVQLDPVPPYDAARGHLLLHPARDAAVLYVFDLPPARAGTSYRVRLRRDDGQVDGPSLRPRPSGDAAVPLRLRGNGSRLSEVAVVLDPSGESVLVGRPAPAPR